MGSPDLKKWREILAPCPVLPEPVASYVFSNIDSLREVRARIIDVLNKYGMPYVTFPDDFNVVTCRMRFILEYFDDLKSVTFVLDLDRLVIDFYRNPTEVLNNMNKRAIAIIDFAIALLREIGLVTSENENKVREHLIKDWLSAIEVPKSLLPILLGRLMSR